MDDPPEDEIVFEPGAVATGYPWSDEEDAALREVAGE